MPKFQAAALGRRTPKLLRTHKHFLHLIIRSARLAHEDSYFYFGSKAVTAWQVLYLTEYSPPWCLYTCVPEETKALDVK